MGLAVASRGIRALPPTLRYRWAGRIGRAVSHLFPSKRASVQKNLDHINAWTGRSFKVDTVFENFGKVLADFLGGGPLAVSVAGRETAESARRAGKGVLFLTSHLGSWELGGRILAGWGWPVTAVYQPYRSEAMQRFIQRRRAPGLHYLAVGRGAAHGVMKALRRQESVAMLGDRPFGEDGFPIVLCGKPARLPRGPFLFSCRNGTPIVPGFVLMDGNGRYRGVVEDALWPTGPEDVQNLMDKMAQVVGKYISTHADQWFCFEPVWE